VSRTLGPHLRRLGPAVALSTCLALVLVGCTTNTGSCDAQGANNGVTCVQSADSPSASTSEETPGLSGSPTLGGSPGLSGSAPGAGSPGPSSAIVGASSLPTENAVPLMVPITNQPGWTLVWSGQKTIGPQGVIFSEVNPTSGPETGTGDDFDLQYISSGSGSGWGSGLNYLYYWTNKYQPGPAIIAGLLQNENFSGQSPVGMLAHVGDRLFAAMDTEAEGFNIVFYMQVAEVGQESVLVNMWIWNST